MSKFVAYISREELFIVIAKNEDEVVGRILRLQGPHSIFKRKEIDDLYVHAHLDGTQSVY